MMKKDWTRSNWRTVLYRWVLRLPDCMKAALVLVLLIPAMWMVFGMAISAVVTK